MRYNKIVLLLGACTLASCAGELPPSSSSTTTSESGSSSSSSSSSASSSSSGSSSSSSKPSEQTDFVFAKAGSQAVLKKYKASSKTVVIPSTYEGLPVTRIYQNAFKNKVAIEKVVLPEGLVSIDEYAFYGCTNLVDISFPSTLKTIGRYSFGILPYLENVVLPEGLERIEDFAFVCDESLRSLTLPSTLKWFGSNCLTGVNALAYTSKNGIDYLGNEENPYLLAARISEDNIAPTSVTFENGTRIIGSSILESETTVTSITLPDGLVAIGGRAFDSTKITAITIPSTVEEIGQYAFESCDALTTCTITGSSLKYIRGEAFSGASALKTINIPDSVLEIGSYAFSKYDEVSDLVYNTYDNGIYLGNSNNPYHALMGLATTGPTSINIHPNTKVIAGQALANANKVTSLTIPNGVRSLCDSAFFQMTSITEAVIPSSVTYMGETVFSNCHKLETLEFQNAPTSIPGGFVSDCENLVALNIPSTVTKLGRPTIQRNDKIRTLVIPESVVEIEEGAIAGTVADGKALQVFLECEKRGELFEDGWITTADWYFKDQWHYVDGVPTVIEKDA